MWQVKIYVGWNENIRAGGAPGTGLRTTGLMKEADHVGANFKAEAFERFTPFYCSGGGDPNETA